MENNKGINSLDAIFKPGSIAVIGATMRPNSLGRTITRNVLEYEFTGKMFPVNPTYEVVQSIKCYKSVLDIPDEVDQAIIIVNKKYVLQVAEECGQKGVKGLVVLSAGFKEVGEQGKEMENKLLKIVRKYNMRMIGPNCMGIINTAPDFSLNGTFAPEHPSRGNIGFMSQSGALGVAIISATKQYNLGLSMFASVGNKADISANDLIEYWGEDPETDIILLYLESLGNPQKFIRNAKKITKHKPIIVVKSGRTIAGAKAATSHTGAIAGVDIAMDALFDHCGVIRVDSIREMFELAVAFCKKKYPKGNRVGIVTNGGGPAIMAADACGGNGLELPTFSATTQKKMREFLAPEAATANPVDMIASGGPDEYEKVLNIISKDKNIDSLLAISVTPPTLIDPGAVLEKINKVADKIDKPLLTVVMGKDVTEGRSKIETSFKHGTYQFPEAPAKALATMLKYAQWREKPEGKIKNFHVNKKAAEKILDKEFKEKKYLSDSDVIKVMRAYGLNCVASQTAKTHIETADTAEKLGFPVVLKAFAKKLVHKSDIGGVAVDLRNRGEVIEAYYNIKQKVDDHAPGTFQGVRVQKMVQDAKEVILGMTGIPLFGKLIMFGLGGIFVEILKDVQFRPAPLTDLDTEEMITSIKGYPILKGARGEKGVNIDIIKESMLRLSQLVCDFDNILAIDINPFMVSASAESSVLVDARILVGPPDNK
ncbi:acetate--CoA ligase family protein [candidate division KSB1 bacterium]